MKKNIFLSLIILSSVLNMALTQTTVNYPAGPLATFAMGSWWVPTIGLQNQKSYPLEWALLILSVCL